ncbi:hypothetical protein ACIBG7_12890 [Nonomuraea sp. NPDC050328]|uniref:hypothetical protein n=1 Tax=Nonomuraea sp. NPDC050328 TaxID=3364361 RepID=UPI00378A33E1
MADPHPVNGSERRYLRRAKTAKDGRDVLQAAWGWLLAELTDLAHLNPTRADAARRDLAEQLCHIARDTLKEVNDEKARQPLRR